MSLKFPGYLFTGVLFLLAACSSPPAPVRAPAPVGDLTAQVTCVAGGASVLLSWASVDNATSYVLERDLEAIANLSATATNHQDTDAIPGDQFKYVLKAVNDVGLTISAPLPVAVPFDVCTRPSKILTSYRNANFMIAADGSLWAWGDNDSHQLGLGHSGNQLLPVRVTGVPAAVAVSAGDWHALMLDSQGRVWAWGNNFDGAAGVGWEIEDQIIPALVPGLPPIVDIAAGHDHSLALDQDGVIWSWGDNSDGQAGHADGSFAVYEPGPITMAAGIQQIAAGSGASYAVDVSGKLYSWGDNSQGQLGLGDFTSRDQPEQVTAITTAVAQVVAGDGYALLRQTDGSVMVMGQGDRLGLGPAAVDSAVPLPNPALAGALFLSAGENHALAIMPDGTALGWGSNDHGQVGPFTGSAIDVPTAIPDISDLFMTTVGEDHSVALTRDGSVYAWGDNDDNQLGWNVPAIRTTFTRIPLGAEVVSVATRSHGLAVDSTGKVWAWGSNNYGQLGPDSTTYSSVPIMVPGLDNITQVAAGTDFSLALEGDGSVWSWGRNTTGQLGHGDYTDRLVPVEIVGLPQIEQLAAGDRHALAIDSTGRVLAWGAGTSGQLGDNSGVDRPTPVGLTSLLPLTAVSVDAGTAFSAVVLNDGSVATFGSRNNGALGDEGSTSGTSLLPVLASVTGIERITAGYNFSIAWIPDSDSPARVWGDNGYGQLGTGNTTGGSTPVDNTSIRKLVSVSAGADHSMAINTAGQLSTWGANHDGQLGLGDHTERLTPSSVSLPGPARAIAAGLDTSFVVTADGELYGSGWDGDGRLGLGRLLDTPVPRLIEDLPLPALYD